MCTSGKGQTHENIVEFIKIFQNVWNELSILSSAYVPIDMANVIGNADDFEESKDEGSSVPEPSVRMTTNHYTKQS